jgi:hypothetical protein
MTLSTPPPRGRERQRQDRRKPTRCHPTTVSGFTMTRTSDHRGHMYRSGLCCKNDSVGQNQLTLCIDGSAFQSEDFPDELNLPKDIPFRQPPHLAFRIMCRTS